MSVLGMALSCWETTILFHKDVILMLLKEQQVQYYGFSTPLYGVLKVCSC